MADIKATIQKNGNINAQVNTPVKISPKHLTIRNVSLSDIGLENVDNTSDLDKPISNATQAELNLKANKNDTFLTGTTTVNDINLTSGSISSSPGSDTDIANKQYVDTKIAGLAQNANAFKSRKIEEIKKARDIEYNAILVTSDGLQFKSDLETIIDVKTLIEILPDGGSFEGYKSADGTYNTITKEQFQNAITEGIARKSAAFAKEAQLVAAVSAATTLTELQSITW